MILVQLHDDDAHDDDAHDEDDSLSLCLSLEYRKRRLELADLAKNYKAGRPIPRIEYTDVEKSTWRAVYSMMKSMHAKYACAEFINNIRLMELHCGYSVDNIPQVQDISKFLMVR